MQRISTSPNGVFKDGVPGVSRGTKCNAAWHNAVQEEICNLIERAGGTLDPNDNGQVYGLLRETLDRIFKGPVSVQDPDHPGTEVTIDPDAVTIYGVKLQRAIVNEIVLLAINECVSIAKALVVNAGLTVKGGVSIEGYTNAESIVCRSIDSILGVICRANLSVGGTASIKALEADSSVFKLAVSSVDFRKEISEQESEIEENDFYGNRIRGRVIVVTGEDQRYLQKSVTITASPVNGRRLHVVNMAVARDGYVFVKWNGSNLCVLGPGADKWFVANLNAWYMDRDTVG